AGRHLKKYVLELGGSDPFIVLPDADLDKAVAGAVAGRMYNGGQACTASKRFIIVGDIYDEFLRRYTDAMSRIAPGDPTDAKTAFGPLSSQSAVEEIDELVQDAVTKGATAVTGGAGPDGPGAYYPATVLTGVTPRMRAYSEEIFGPAAVVFHVDSPEAAIDLANDSPYGLSSSIYTADVDYAQQLADQLETGMVWINSISRSAPDLPFGGVKRSGVGRELAQYGINEFANKKLVRFPKA
ncbi:aldehyde dehydrogenase family protein, partial [Arthrobacter sp.]|uniref:aldehyde dehydrogenase family protein n=1 Tax=Arthrobacter sp. TaxID=1667 RepID=UPI0033929E8C